MALKIDTKIEGERLVLPKIDFRKLANFHHSTIESLKIWNVMGSFRPKQKIYELKIYRGIMCHENEE